MRVALVHNALPPSTAPDEADVLVQVEAVTDALHRLGHRTEILDCDLNLDSIASRLTKFNPDRVFNLVESLNGSGRLIHCFPALLDAMGLPYTGASAEALFLTSNKLLAKGCLRRSGVPTPLWVGCYGGWSQSGASIDDDRSRRWIIKSVWEHASIGLDNTSIVENGQTHLLAALMAQRAPKLGGACFAEEFIEGREFNLSLLGGDDGPRVLPPAEIIFDGYAEDRPRIVDYDAKWRDDSFAYHHTPRCFDFPEQDRPLLKLLEETACQCWKIFGLRGYARVDFRVDAAHRPWVLEINANPCISPDAGFSAAVEQSGMTYVEAIENILASVGIAGERPIHLNSFSQGEGRAQDSTCL